MRLPRFRIRTLMLAVAVVACGAWYYLPKVPSREVAVRAAEGAVPGIVIKSVTPGQFNSQASWDVRGTDPSGTEWIIDIAISGEILMKEDVAWSPPVLPTSGPTAGAQK